MHPEIGLDPQVLAENLRAWRAFAGVPVRAVIKCDGYGWGMEPLIAALDAECDAFCVADFEEFELARAWTGRPIVLLARIAPADLPAALDAGAIPCIETLEDIAACAAWQAARGTSARVRLGILPAASWSGVDPDAVPQLAPALAAAGFDLEVWSHVTDPQIAALQTGRVAEAVRFLNAAGVAVSGSDVSSTFALAQNGAAGSNVRIGVGLFGSTGGTAVPGVRCALRVSAPVVRCDFLKKGTRVGYGSSELAQDGYVLTARCGYGDGLPKTLAGTSDILSVGMQYVTLKAPNAVEPGTPVCLADARTDLDRIAAAAGAGTHELITAFGNASQRMNATNRNRGT